MTPQETWYVDTSAALKLMVKEPESAALIEAINTRRPSLASSFLLETEVRRVAAREPKLGQERATALLDRFDLHPVTAIICRQAGLLPGEHLRSLDALHVATAIAAGIDTLVTYDTRMMAAARDSGLTVLAPSAS